MCLALCWLSLETEEGNNLTVTHKSQTVNPHLLCYVSMEKSFDVQAGQQLRYEGLKSGEGDI